VSRLQGEKVRRCAGLRIRPSLVAVDRALTYEEAFSAARVVYSIEIGALAVYYTLKLPLDLPQGMNGPAIFSVACVSVFIVLHFARIRTNWKSTVTKSSFWLLIVPGIIGASIPFGGLSACSLCARRMICKLAIVILDTPTRQDCGRRQT
jgi:hypothetical protein